MSDEVAELAGTMQAETQALRVLYAALNKGDVPAAVEVFDQQVEWTDPDGATYRGMAVVQDHFSQARANWAEGSCEQVRFIAAGDKVVVFADVRVRLRDETEWREGRTADVYTFRDGKVIEARAFGDRQQGLEWAGVKTSDAN
jgi:ketosteroid isomerase-like protein